MPNLPFDDLPDLRSASLVDQVYGELRRRLLDGRLLPGTEVPDSVIAKQMSVSRAPVRDALNRLVQDGLLTKRPNYPYMVRTYTDADVSEIMLLRWGYEVVAVRQLVVYGLPVVGHEDSLNGMDRARDQGDVTESFRCDMAFHLALVASAGLPELTRLHRIAVEQLLTAPLPQDVPAFILERQRSRHGALLGALQESQRMGTPDGALKELSRHILAFRSESEDDPLV